LKRDSALNNDYGWWDDDGEGELTQAIIYRYKDSNYFEVEAPYNEQFIAVIKRLPVRDRYWWREGKRWGFRHRYFAVMRNICREHFDYVDVEDLDHDPLAAQKKEAELAVRMLIDTVMREKGLR
jgi:hypothetical protein